MDRKAISMTHISESRGVFNGPFLCDTDRNGNMLVADWGNNRVQVYNDEQWQVLSLQAQPPKPTYAIFTDNLAVCCRNGQKNENV